MSGHSEKAPAGPKSQPDGSRSPYQDSSAQGKPHAYPKGQGEYKGRGGYPPRGNCKSGGYKE